METELLVLVFVFLALLIVLGWRYHTLAERLTKQEAERNEDFLRDCMVEVANIRSDYDALFEKQFDRMQSMLDTKALESYTDAQTQGQKISDLHAERMVKAELELAKPVPYVPQGKGVEPTEQVGVGSGLPPEI